MLRDHLRGIGAILCVVAVGACSGGASESSTESEGSVTSELSRRACDNVCTLTVEGDEVVRYVSVREDGLSFQETRTIKMPSPGAGALSEKGTIRHGSQTLFSYTATGGPDGNGTVDVTWGHQVRGLKSADTDIAGNKLTGTINGRQFLPFGLDQDPKTAIFVDGKPAPEGDLPGKGMVKQLERLDAEVKKVTAHCEVVTSPSDQDSAAMLAAAAAAPAQDTGHFSDTYSTLRCDGCKATVVGAATVTCGILCVGTFGIGCPACIAGAAVGVPAGILACENSNACCPVACGGGFPGTCCFGAETCLNGDGLCCSQGKTTCGGKGCCSSDESCVSGGPRKGTCCKDSLFCGVGCCKEGENCFNAGTGQCCAPNLVCGSTCCGGIDDKLSYCLDPKTSTCCASNLAACGGKCCSVGQVCGASGECETPPPPVCTEPCQNNGDCDITVDEHNKCNLTTLCCQSTPF